MNYLNPIIYANATPPLQRASSTPLRKRSMPDKLARLSFAARKSESDRDLTAALAPLGVVFMEQIALDVAVARDAQRADAKYVLSVRHLKTQATWRHVRTFDEYRRFQHRLLKAVNHGHFCSAECPWLYTFLKSYFPKKSLFHFVTSRVVALRTDALQRFFVSLQSFLLNRANHSCSRVATDVVDVVVEFIYGDYAKHYQLEDPGVDNQRGSSFSLKGPVLVRGPECLTSTEDDDTSSTSGSSSCAGLPPVTLCCVLCESSLDGEAYASSRSDVSVVTSSSSSTSSGFESTVSTASCTSEESLMDTRDLVTALSVSAPAKMSTLTAAATATTRRGTHYVMTLGCGHQFHDECIVPKLNETLRCPTCDHLEVK